jgi:hypothetical protein
MALIDKPPVNSPVDDKARGRVFDYWQRFFFNVFKICFAVTQSGAVTARPTTGLWVGRPYFDTSLGIPIWWDGADWIDAAGNSV